MESGRSRGVKGVEGRVYYYIESMRKRNLRQLDNSPMFGTSSDLRSEAKQEDIHRLEYDS